MPELQHRLINAIDIALGRLPPRRRLVLAVSGGLDSMLLLAMAARRHAAGRGPSLQVLHVHHGLYPQADDWAGLVVQACAALEVPCRVLRVTVDLARPSREAAAREARHGALAAELRPGDALLLAHHADDQAETLLLRLARGSGLSGMGGMREARPVTGVEDAWLLRPWLAFERASLAQAAADAGLSWVEDPSNNDTTLDRNFLRHAVMPRLRERWPAVAGVMARDAAQLAGSDALLNDYLDADLAPLLSAPDPRWARLSGEAPTLDAAALLERSPAAQRALLRRWLALAGAPLLESRWLDELLRLAAARVDAEGELRVGGWAFHRFRGRLHAFATLLDAPALPPAEHPLAGILDLGAARLRVLPADADEGLPLAGLAAGTRIEAGFRRGGERLRPRAGSGSRPLKKILQDLDVPPWLRARVPLLWSGGQLVAVGDLLADEAFTPRADRPATLRLLWCAPAQST